jgi:isopenicillin N synthase-like dioxygenase
MRLLHYPPQTGAVDDRVQGIGAHTEYVVTVASVGCQAHTFSTKCVSYEVG